MLVGDEEGTIKYFDSNYKEIKVLQRFWGDIQWKYLGS